MELKTTVEDIARRMTNIMLDIIMKLDNIKIICWLVAPLFLDAVELGA